MQDKFKSAMHDLIEMADQQYAELIIDLAASKTWDSDTRQHTVCHEVMHELGKLEEHVEDIFEIGLKLHALKGMYSHGDHTNPRHDADGITFGRARR